MSKSKYGVQVDAWAALVPDKGNVSKEIYQFVWDTLNARLPYLLRLEEDTQPPKPELLKVDLQFAHFLAPFYPYTKARSHILVRRELTLYTQYSVAVRIAHRGQNDLELSWRILEKDWVQSIIEPALWALIALPAIVLGYLILSSTHLPDWGDFLKDFWGTFNAYLRAMITLALIVLPPAILILGTSLVISRLRRKPDGTQNAWLDTYDQYDSRMLALAVSGIIWEALDTHEIAPSEVRELRRIQRAGVAQITGWPDI